MFIFKQFKFTNNSFVDTCKFATASHYYFHKHNFCSDFAESYPHASNLMSVHLILCSLVLEKNTRIYTCIYLALCPNDSAVT